MRLKRKKEKAPAPAKVLAIGYVRVSTGLQEMSPAVQAERIRGLAALQGCKLVKIITDKESAKEGSIHERAGILEAQWLIEHGEANRIIVAKLDRLTRSVVDLGELLTWMDRKNATLVSVNETWMDTGSAAGRMIVNIMTSVAQWEREAISERTSAVLQYKKANNLPYNHVAFGMRLAGRAQPGKVMVGRRLVPELKEQKILTRMRWMRGRGMTFAKIAATLNSEGVPTKGRRRGGRVVHGKWHASTIRNLL